MLSNHFSNFTCILKIPGRHETIVILNVIFTAFLPHQENIMGKHSDIGNKNLPHVQQPFWLCFTWSRGRAYGTWAKGSTSSERYPVTL